MVSPTMDANASRLPSGLVSPRHVRSRTQSISSDRPSTIGYGVVLPPVFISPPAAFIASSAASQIITNDHDSHADAWYDQNGIDPAAETATVSASALQLVNSFLDQLLFNVLQVSKSTALSALRPAVIEVLKPKLGRDVVSNADEELREYLGGANEEDQEQFQGPSSSRNWDGELVWKRTRLRCMVYSSLGDMEEEDEDAYMEEENLDIGAHEQISDTISPPVAIFLTSVIEYMGELTLTVAGQAAYQRVRSKIEKELKDGARNTSDPADRIVVTDLDMERVALDRTLGRLWRGWKKRMRTPANDIAGSLFPKGPPTPCKPGQMEIAHDVLSPPKSATSDSESEFRDSQEHFEGPIMEDVQPVDIPLPLGDNDVDEIEVPGLTHYSDDEGDDEGDDEMDDDEVQVRKRPKSLVLSSSMFANGLPTPTKSQPHTPTVRSRQRSTSLPTPRIPHFPPKTHRHIPPSTSESEADQDTVAEIGIAMSTDGHGSLSEANAEPIAADVPAKKDVDARSQSSESDYDGTEEVAFEKAEIMTTSRISMSSSAQSTDSDSNGKATPMKRSSSVHSARIIDVPAPRSPARSRPTSLDATEQLRPVRVSGIASGFARTAASDDRFKATSNETPIKAAINALPPRSSHDKRKPSASNTAPISELEEEASQNFTRAVNQPDNSADATEMEAAGSTSSAMSQRRKGMLVTLNTKIQSSSKYEQSPVSARTVSLPATPASPDIAKGNAPDLPKKASVHSGWNSPKPETKSRLSIERTRTHESDELSLPAQQQNTSGSRQVSQAHTSVSSVSSGASRLKPVRTSEDSSSRSESVARNFEELIQSNQTITYTLTPENMRDIDAKRSLDSPVVTKFARRKSEDARAHQYSPKASPILTPSAAGNLPSPRLPPSPASPKIVESKAIINPAGPVPPAPTTITAPTARANGATAREARVRSDSVSDFAEFIKSTGPAGETKSYTVPKLGSPPLSSDKGYRESRRASATSIVNRLRYQPRDATVDSRVDNSDLIDFIRQGPPIAASNHRIPRHVAPFRTTMDSDQMSGAVGGKAIDANIPDIRSSRTSTNVTESSMPSMQSSVNSKSALIKHKAPKVPNKLFDDDDNMMPKPKTRRVRDPYAIDFSDEEGGVGQDDHILDTPKLPVKKEESLAEFLRNYEPPPEPVSAPAPRLPRKKASAPSLIGRFTRGGKDKEKEKDSASIKGMPEARSVSRASSGRGYIPIQVNIPPGYDKYNPMNGNIGANRARGPSTTSSTAGRVPMKKFEPREAASKRSETADLAAFFRDSGPPLNNSPMVIDRRSSQQEDSGGLTKRFGRKKKPLAL
ncbi:flo11 [Metarhizium robertsii ARSEF 23]|uniref:Flo11 n=2 Tax=Metarhizium robertsii TaxID=568076 RepID=E9F038_METRA|nr:flo11 [Metarhizium robertsii ARSEF 23]EFY98498.1 flo11 [Metarhizium robertsii ARSEF 23]